MKNRLKLDPAAISTLTKHLLTSQVASERSSFYSPLLYFKTFYKLISNCLPQMIQHFQYSGQYVSHSARAPLLQNTVLEGVKVRMTAHALMAGTVSIEGPTPVVTIGKGKEIQRKH